MDAIEDFFVENFGWILVVVLVVASVGLGLAIHYDSVANERERAAFMSQCGLDHKQYECTAMWRSGESNGQVMQIPIIIQTGR